MLFLRDHSDSNREYRNNEKNKNVNPVSKPLINNTIEPINLCVCWYPIHYISSIFRSSNRQKM